MKILFIFNSNQPINYAKRDTYHRVFNTYVKEIKTCGFSNPSKYAAAEVKLRPFKKKAFLKRLSKIKDATYFIVKE